MIKKRRVLIVSEGADDKWFVRRLFEHFMGDCSYEVVTFKTDVYQLYEMCSEPLEETYLPSLLLERNKQLSSEERKRLLMPFTDIFLIFDFDPQAETYDANKLLTLMGHFCDSTDYGQLYINYPMLESYRYIPEDDLQNGGISKTFQMAEFLENELRSDKKGRNKFKRDVAKFGFTRKAISQDEWLTIIKNHSCKARRLIRKTENKNLSQKNFITLLKKQSESFNRTKRAKILNTSLLLVEEYYACRIEDCVFPAK